MQVCRPISWRCHFVKTSPCIIFPATTHAPPPHGTTRHLGCGLYRVILIVCAMYPTSVGISPWVDMMVSFFGISLGLVVFINLHHCGNLHSFRAINILHLYQFNVRGPREAQYCLCHSLSGFYPIFCYPKSGEFHLFFL